MENNKIQVWQSLRSSIGTWDVASSALSIAGSALIFSAYGIVIANSNELGTFITAFISFALFIASCGFYFQLSQFANSSIRGVKRAKEIEDLIFGKDEKFKITHMLTKNMTESTGFRYNYYKIWAAGFVAISGFLTIWKIAVWLTIFR